MKVIAFFGVAEKASFFLIGNIEDFCDDFRGV